MISRFGAFLCVLVFLPIIARAQDVHVKVSPELKWDEEHRTTFPTIQNALDHAPEPSPSGRLYIEITPGIYHERIYVSQFRPRTTLLGMGKDPSQVVIISKQNPESAQSTFFTETAEVLATDFQADNLTFENSAGPTGQAVAVSVSGDRAIFKHCRFLGFQDTLFANFGRQYYVDSYIAGAVDFIFGNAAAVFEKDEIHVIGPGYLTAHSKTSAEQNTGYVILHSRVTADNLQGRTFMLGRPWRNYAHVVIASTELPAELDPKGWSDWGRSTEHVFFAEAENTGPGANMSQRVSWVHHLDAAAIRQFEPGVFLSGDDHWDPVAEAAKLP